MSLNQPFLLSSALVHQVLLSPTTYPYKQVASRSYPHWGFGKFDVERLNERIGLLATDENKAGRSRFPGDDHQSILSMQDRPVSWRATYRR